MSLTAPFRRRNGLPKNEMKPNRLPNLRDLGRLRWSDPGLALKLGKQLVAKS
jgi:hypothetical protein